MVRKSKKYLKRYASCLLSVIMIATFCLGAAGLTNVFGSSPRKIDVWDFGCVAETDETLYNNNIKVADWDNCSNVGTDGKFIAGTTTFGDLVIAHNAGDRLYSPSTKNAGTFAKSTTAYDDGYTGNGLFYCNGTGGENRRYFTIDNVQAGDKIIVYMGASNSVTAEDICFKYLGTGTEQQLDKQVFSGVAAKYEFVAQYSGAYKIYTGTVGGKPCYNRVVRVPGVNVSGSLDLGSYSLSGYTLTFTNNRTGAVTNAQLDGKNFSATLAAGDTYTASFLGATGYGLTNATKTLATTLSDVKSGKSGVSLKVEEKIVYHYTGKITGFDLGYDLSKLKVTLKGEEGSYADDVLMNLGTDLSYDVMLVPEVTYTVVMEGANDYEITVGSTIKDDKAHASDITVAKKALYKVSGGFKDLPSTSSVTGISFKNLDDSYEYPGTITATGYEANLRDGSYSVSATVDGYTTHTHVVVKGQAVSKDLLFVSTAAAPSLTKVSDIYVGYPDKGALNYSTVRAAVAGCAAMNPQSETERITIHIAPGTYREQVIVATPYITFANDTDQQVLLTWYYGIGYKYYSADATGYYNPENAYDQFDKNIVQRWGASTYLKSAAKEFKAKGITFEASFNRYLTDEELADGVEITGDGITLARQIGTDVTSKTATERSTALAIDADNVEFLNCSFLGSQDTLFTGNDNTNLYFKNCLVEGNTDYIFGDGNCIFDSCELRWYGYSSNSVGGFLTAAKPDKADYGYLFRNCTITANPDLTVTPGYFGRPWAKNAKVKFVNTKLASDNLIVGEGWTDMSGNLPTAANFAEYNTTLLSGATLDVSKRVVTPVTQDPVATVPVTNYLGDLTSSYYSAEDATVAFTTNPYVTDNGDMNAPYPGHTLTVHYSLGSVNDLCDASIIRWYSVDNDGKETLVKSSTAIAGKTYKITSADMGKFIKVKVLPQTISGASATEASYKVEAFVRNGYEDPTGASSDITLGEGVNIFLAGDSTVKDYSISGMYMKGIAQQEGSWGEFLQTFFNPTQVKVQNYANGGRSSRSFINEGSLDKIKTNIKSGDYLFIQFGHNDCANSSGYLDERFVPLGEPDVNGIYPTTAGVKSATPSSYVGTYGAEYYSVLIRIMSMLECLQREMRILHSLM